MAITSKCRAVANYIIEKTNEYNEDETFREQVMMSCKRLQRLLYFCNVKYLILHNGEFLFEDDFYAWPTGPVIPGIYYVFVPYLVGKNIPRYEGSLLDESCRFLIMNQIEYSKKLGIPWGISEAAFNLKDLHSNYQYKAFGVPWLGLKRGLADDMVAATYGSVLAVTDKQYSEIRNYLGAVEKAKPEVPQQLELF